MLLDREKAGREVPELLDRPPLDKRTEWLMDAFDRLSTERQLGFGAYGPIPHSAVVKEALRLELGQDGLHELWYIVHALDEQWRASVNKVKSPPSTGAKGGRLQDKDIRRSVRSGRRKSHRDGGGGEDR